MTRMFAALGAALLAAPIAAQAPAVQPLGRAAFIASMDSEYRRLDANNDGSATRAEVEANQRRILADVATRNAQAQFARIDTDRNGQISSAEFLRAAAGSPQRVDVTRQMGRLDANRDGKVTIVEYRTLTVANFDRLDTDKDGILSAAEQRAGGYAR